MCAGMFTGFFVDEAAGSQMTSRRRKGSLSLSLSLSLFHFLFFSLSSSLPTIQWVKNAIERPTSLHPLPLGPLCNEDVGYGCRVDFFLRFITPNPRFRSPLFIGPSRSRVFPGKNSRFRALSVHRDQRLLTSSPTLQSDSECRKGRGKWDAGAVRQHHQPLVPKNCLLNVHLLDAVPHLQVPSLRRWPIRYAESPHVVPEKTPFAVVPSSSVSIVRFI